MTRIYLISFIDSVLGGGGGGEQDPRTTLWVEEWNALGERSTEWRDRGIITNEHLASGTDEPWGQDYKKKKNSTQSKSQTHNARAYKVTSFLSTDCELSTETCSRFVYSLGPLSIWRSLNRLRVQKGRCRAMMKMWKLSHTDVCDCGERQTMSHLMTCGDAPNCTWTDLAFPTLAGVNCAKHWEESI